MLEWNVDVVTCDLCPLLLVVCLTVDFLSSKISSYIKRSSRIRS
jgi:hypothetical protein